MTLCVPVPPKPPPELVQLETPHARTAMNAAISRNLRRRRQASGSNTNPQASGSTRHLAGASERTDDPDFPVEICAVTFPVAPALTCMTLPGLKRQSVLAGSVPHWNVNVPANPFAGVITNGK